MLLRCSHTSCLSSAQRFGNKCIAFWEPLLAFVAASLVLVVAFVTFFFLLPKVYARDGPWATAIHALLTATLLFNILWNHCLSVFTCPGFSTDVDVQVLREAMSYDWRWCGTCNRAKPPLAHHCSVCQKCVFKMDHHCPWMWNCIGYYNYKYFFLYLFYLSIGSGYAAFLLWRTHSAELLDLSGPAWPAELFALTVLCVAVCAAVTILMVCHVALILSGQGSIDALTAYVDKQDAVRRGVPYVRHNPFHLGPARNWKETFDVQDNKWWCLVWPLPRWAPKSGCPWDLPRRDYRETLQQLIPGAVGTGGSSHVHGSGTGSRVNHDTPHHGRRRDGSVMRVEEVV